MTALPPNHSASDAKPAGASSLEASPLEASPLEASPLEAGGFFAARWGWPRVQLSPEALILLLAIAIGTGTGLLVMAFRWGIGVMQSLTFEYWIGGVWPGTRYSLALGPVLGGLLVGLLRWRWSPLGPNLAALIQVAQGKAPLSPTKALLKAIAAIISIGSGASVGPEGPSVEIGGGVGLICAELLQVSRERMQLLLGAGTAAGLAAGFNAPIAGVFFALEVVLGPTFATSGVSLILLSAVVSGLIVQVGLGGQAAFDLPAYEIRSPFWLPFYLGLGLLASGVALAFSAAVDWAGRLLSAELPGGRARLPEPLRPVLGGLVVGGAALVWPQVLGVGYETMEAMLRGEAFSLPLLASLLVVKLGMTALSVGSGLVGGLFAPALFLGASLGSAYGQLLPLLLPIDPQSIAAPPAYAMVGMAAVLAASVRAPLTAVLLLFELTRDYRIILPLMAAVSLSVWLVEQVQPRRLEASALVTQTSEAAKLEDLSVAQVYQSDYLQLSAHLSLVEAAQRMLQVGAHSALVFKASNPAPNSAPNSAPDLNPEPVGSLVGELMGIVTLKDLNRALYSGREPLPCLAQICTTELVYAELHEPLTDAVARMNGRGLQQLPVIDRDRPDRILGLLTHSQITAASDFALTRRAIAEATVIPLLTRDLPHPNPPHPNPPHPNPPHPNPPHPNPAPPA
jgi:H+/Cl- antiporter ClcA